MRREPVQEEAPGAQAEACLVRPSGSHNESSSGPLHRDEFVIGGSPRRLSWTYVHACDKYGAGVRSGVHLANAEVAMTGTTQVHGIDAVTAFLEGEGMRHEVL